MKLQVAVLLAMGLVGVAAWKSKTLQHSEFMETCDFEKLDGPDSQFCQGDLQVFYPELGDVGCTYIPKCHQYRKRISKEWRDPEIKYPRAEKNKSYVLIMADPDAPSRSDPKFRFWRHWLVIDIQTTSAPRLHPGVATIAISSACTNSRLMRPSPSVQRKQHPWVPGHWSGLSSSFDSDPLWLRPSSSLSTTMTRSSINVCGQTQSLPARHSASVVASLCLPRLPQRAALPRTPRSPRLKKEMLVLVLLVTPGLDVTGPSSQSLPITAGSFLA
uniref:Phosphatidylethanolamine binding protein 4 n=1 Tax=Crocodylus porosus TaxID=8502 RepID=A0A7M4G0L7_CROPO